MVGRIFHCFGTWHPSYIRYPPSALVTPWAALFLIYCPQLRGVRAAARRPASGPIQGHGPDVRHRPGSSRRRAVPRVWPRRLRCWSAPPAPRGRETARRPTSGADPGPRPGCQAEAGQLQAVRCAPVCGPGGSGADLLPPVPREQGSGQEARQRADPGPRPGCQAEAGRLQAARCTPVCGPWAAPALVCFSPTFWTMRTAAP